MLAILVQLGDAFVLDAQLQMHLLMAFVEFREGIDAVLVRPHQAVDVVLHNL